MDNIRAVGNQRVGKQTRGLGGIKTNKTTEINLKILEWSEGEQNRLIILANIKFKA